VRQLAEVQVIRITIQDATQTISFLAKPETLMRLIAGCSINPADLSELLIATDIYQRGFAAQLMADLMTFDRAIHRQGYDFVHQAIRTAKKNRQPLEMAFQVIDKVTEREATQPRVCPLAVIDLNARTIHASKGAEISPSGEVRISIGETETDQTVSYILPHGWQIEQG
jgi:hypothetical protein